MATPLSPLPATIISCLEAEAKLKANVISQNNFRRPRTIVLCLDGTGDLYDEDNSNVVKFFATLRKDAADQLTYYQSGIGTYDDSYSGKLKMWWRKAAYLGIGASLDIHVRDAYRFLMQNYREGDHICIFGFSRGAYTARALAGMLHKVGLLPANNQAQLGFAYQWYADESKQGWDMSGDFKNTFSTPVRVAFLGCWDTVASVGLYSTTLPFAKTNTRAIDHFRHALSLDERRIKFLPTRWGKQGRNNGAYRPLQGAVVEQARKLANDHGRRYARPLSLLDMTVNPFIDFLKHEDMSFRKACENFVVAQASVLQMLYLIMLETILSPMDHALSLLGFYGADKQYNTQSGLISIAQIITLWMALLVRRFDNYIWAKYFFDSKGQQANEKVFDESLPASPDCNPEAAPTDVLEVFFAGEHSDCGGGTVANTTRSMASRIALRWMIRQTFECNAHIHFRTEVLAQHGLDVDMLWPRYLPRDPLLEPSMFDPAHPPKLMSSKATLKAIRTRIPDVPPKASLNGSLGIELTGALARDCSPQPATLSPETQTSDLEPQSDASTNATSVGAPDDETVKQRADDQPTLTLPSQPSSVEPILVPPPFTSIEDAEDHADALSPLHDQLVGQKLWWFVEAFPLRFRTKLPNGKLRKVRAPHLGRHRAVTEKEPLMHHTVALRLVRGPYRVVNPIEDEANWQVVA